MPTIAHATILTIKYTSECDGEIMATVNEIPGLAVVCSSSEGIFRLLSEAIREYYCSIFGFEVDLSCPGHNEHAERGRRFSNGMPRKLIVVAGELT